MTSMQVREKAADLIEEVGWSRNVGEDDQGRVCLVVALQRSADRGVLDIVNELKRELGESSLVNWQDRSGRTKEEVLALLRGARQ